MTDTQCRTIGASHANDTCDGTGQCRHICSQTTDCTGAGAEHAAERCLTIAGAAACPDPPGSPSGLCACHHTHDPEAIAPGALLAVVDVFSLHGVALHIVRGQERPHSHVVSFRSNAQMSVACEGASVAGNTAGIGKYAASFYDLKLLPPGARYISRYALFAHLSGCDSTVHCPANPGNSSDCLTQSFAYGQSGTAELDGGDIIVSLGASVNDTGQAPGITSPAGFSFLGATFMHELGHTLGIQHDGHVDRPCATGSDCDASDTCIDLDDGEGKVCHSMVGGLAGAGEPNYKPNYVSVMNYLYQHSGIESSSSANVAAPGMPYTTGSNVVDPALTRLDYSNQVLATLHENNLDDVPGLGWQTDPLYPGAYLLFKYTDALCHTCPQLAPATGSVDWECANCATTPACVPLGSGPAVFNATSVSADVDGPGVCDTSPSDTLTGHKDWGNFVYRFQCAPNFDD